jgi:hypothetical protein
MEIPEEFHIVPGRVILFKTLGKLFFKKHKKHKKRGNFGSRKPQFFSSRYLHGGFTVGKKDSGSSSFEDEALGSYLIGAQSLRGALTSPIGTAVCVGIINNTGRTVVLSKLEWVPSLTVKLGAVLAFTV